MVLDAAMQMSRNPFSVAETKSPRVDGATDGLLCLSKERYKTGIKFHADMNLNMIRRWGGGLAERPKFYHCCDIYGLLLWQEFWIIGDVDGQG
ncbi:hypothetical protein CMV_021574 [Castanea mollissima]|uniref:Uncharacterized protein n=1 Tax=Castanea mollissima TaxID=60419 RepID=A0A8J4VLI7_9ROSI|nr:hypothetical protein CMV_021574 [Castanea mollissima]